MLDVKAGSASFLQSSVPIFLGFPRVLEILERLWIWIFCFKALESFWK